VQGIRRTKQATNIASADK